MPKINRCVPRRWLEFGRGESLLKEEIQSSRVPAERLPVSVLSAATIEKASGVDGTETAPTTTRSAVSERAAGITGEATGLYGTSIWRPTRT